MGNDRLLEGGLRDDMRIALHIGSDLAMISSSRGGLSINGEVGMAETIGNIVNWWNRLIGWHYDKVRVVDWE